VSVILISVALVKCIYVSGLLDFFFAQETQIRAHLLQ